MSNKNNNGKAPAVSRQIAVYKTNTKLLEFNDKLNQAPIANYAHIHAQSDDDGNGKRIYSLIGLVLQDYSKSKDDNTVRITANITPDEAQYIFSRAQACVENFEFSSEKIFGDKDGEGYSRVTKLRIARATIGSDKQPRKYPWYVECENGRGVSVKNSTGGSYCKSGSYIDGIKVFLNLNDLDFFKLLNRVSSYITVWESQYGASVMVTGKTELEAQYLEAVKNKNSAA